MLDYDKFGSEHVKSSNSGRYHIGPINDADAPRAELSLVQAHELDLAPEEFPEGPYGAATNEEKLGKVSPWREGQAFSPRFRDSNPVDSDRTVPLDEPPADAPRGSIEGQN